MFVIFGSSGYIGTHLVNYLLSKGESIIGVSRTEPKIFYNKELFKFVKHDLLYPIRREDIIEESIPIEDALANCDDCTDREVVVPKVVE